MKINEFRRHFDNTWYESLDSSFVSSHDSNRRAVFRPSSQWWSCNLVKQQICVRKRHWADICISLSDTKRGDVVLQVRVRSAWSRPISQHSSAWWRNASTVHMDTHGSISSQLDLPGFARAASTQTSRRAVLNGQDMNVIWCTTRSMYRCRRYASQSVSSTLWKNALCLYLHCWYNMTTAWAAMPQLTFISAHPRPRHAPCL